MAATSGLRKGRKGEVTRRLILERAAPVFNKRGYAGTSMSEVVEATGLWADDPLIAGGCPIMNTAIESDDTHPALAARARDAMDSWHRLIGSIVKEAKARGEIDPDVDPYQLATLVTSTLEGSLMLSKLFHDPMHEQRAVASLTSHVESLRRTRGRGKGRANR